MFVCQFIFLLLHNSQVVTSQNAKKANENVQMQVRAVFINCELNENDSTFPESERTRFNQEELFRHGSLTNCNKKLAITVKLTGETDGNFGDEYVPIEHVINGPSKRRTRLLNPYILRLRREPPLQAYELRKIDTVNGIFTNTDHEEDESLNIKRNFRNNVNWYPRDNRKSTEKVDFDIEELNQMENNSPKENYFNKKFIDPEAFIGNEKDLSNITFKNRFKRREYNDEVQKRYENRKQMWIVTDNIISDLNKFQQSVYDNNNNKYGTPEDYSYSYSKINKLKEQTAPNSIKPSRDALPKSILLFDKKAKNQFNNKYQDNLTTQSSELEVASTEAINNIDIVEKPYALYEIGTPDMWSTIHVQLFEKLNAPNGQTAWNDITNGESASVSSTVPDWGNENLNIRYQSTEWVARDDFTLPNAGLCLLTPIRDRDENHFVDDISFINGQKYFVLPTDAIVTLDDSSSLTKRSQNDSDESRTSSRRRVQIRLSRALLSGNDEKMSITTRGKGRFLTIPYRRSCRGQIDLEAKADGNQLVTVGSSGRITTAVSDSTRPTSTTLTLQITNNGLAAARFRGVVRDCRPALKSESDNKDTKEMITERLLIPPKQTRMSKLHISNEVPVDSSHCSVALLNDFDEQVAMRDVTIRKGDRCFCVWHCYCVCLSEDPKLLCREMPVSHQIAAGLSSHNRRRRARSVCYNDIVSIDVCVIIIGVITALLLLGLLKALIGLFIAPVRNWGLDRVLQTPRKLDHYYEESLRSRPVVYDSDGWPVHPDTKNRTVHFVSRSTEFILNIIYFIVTPCLTVREAIKTIVNYCKSREKTDPGKSSSKDNKKCYSTQDMQSVEPRWRQRRGGLRRWMTPPAEELSADLWRKALPSRQPIKCEFMQPLLHEHHYHNANGVLEGQDSCLESEQEDTEYVLMQMQKSKDSLRRCQRKHNDSEVLSKKYTKSKELTRGIDN